MNINTITTDDLRGMEGKDGLILQGCGGDLKEWVDGINDMFTEAGILKDGSKFEDVSAFQYGELTCLLYPFEDVKLDIGKLAIWRLQTHADFGGTWLSDFVPNRLGGFFRIKFQRLSVLFAPALRTSKNGRAAADRPHAVYFFFSHPDPPYRSCCFGVFCFLSGSAVFVSFICCRTEALCSGSLSESVILTYSPMMFSASW